MMARRLGAQNLVLLESDNLSVVKMMSTSDGARSVMASTWHDVQELTSSFISISFTHVNHDPSFQPKEVNSR
jgi:hypothetical protein